MRLYGYKKSHVVPGKSRKIPRYGFKERFLETLFEERSPFDRCLELFTVGFALGVAVTRYEPRECRRGRGLSTDRLGRCMTKISRMWSM